ncbi:MAG: hypothetical protein KGM17_07155 [Sphingomonadales bacterium]|nr:hypothetical protein [Sphingomonadales bacterium]
MTPGLASLFRPRRSGWWQAILLLLSLAITGQGVAIQSHLSAHRPTADVCAAAAAGVSCPAPAGKARAHDAAHCALCQEARIAGHYLPIAAVALALAVLARFRPAARPGIARRAPAPRPPWRSRAPPPLPV